LIGDVVASLKLQATCVDLVTIIRFWTACPEIRYRYLVSAGNVKRDRIARIKDDMKQRGETNIDEASIAENLPEQEILIQSVCETMVPKLVTITY
jgi:hypothetical protein